MNHLKSWKQIAPSWTLNLRLVYLEILPLVHRRSLFGSFNESFKKLKKNCTFLVIICFIQWIRACCLLVGSRAHCPNVNLFKYLWMWHINKEQLIFFPLWYPSCIILHIKLLHFYWRWQCQVPLFANFAISMKGFLGNNNGMAAEIISCKEFIFFL